MVHPNRPVVAREYKLILNHLEFAERENAIESFTNSIKTRLEVLATSDNNVRFLEDRDDKKRKVWYLDTNDFKIRDNKFLLRIRMKKDGDYETSLKCRAPDRYIATSYDLSSGRKKVKSKFEEDIIAPFASNFSLSATFETKYEPRIESMGDLVSIFPGLGVLKIDNNENLTKVKDFEAREISCQIGKIDFGSKLSGAETSLEFWYLPGEVKNQPPLIVEFTFDYGAAGLETKEKPKEETTLEEFPATQVSTANSFYRSVQEIKKFKGLETAKTKTQFAYEYPKDI